MEQENNNFNVQKENKKSKAPLIIIVSILLVVIIALAIVLPKLLKSGNGLGGSNQTETKLVYYDGGWLTQEAMAEVFENTVEIKYYSDYRVDNCRLITETVSLDSFIYVPMNGELNLNDNDFRYYKEITFTFKFDQRLKIEQFEYQGKGNPDESYVYGVSKHILASTYFFMPLHCDKKMPVDGIVPHEGNNYNGTAERNLRPEAYPDVKELKTPMYTDSISSDEKKFTLIFRNENTLYNENTFFQSNIFTNSNNEECYRMSKTCIYDFKFKIDPTIF